MAERKRLYRSRRDRLLAGVCGGIAEYFEIDPILVRLLFVLLFFTAEAGVIAYVIAWIIIPEKPVEREEGDAVSTEDEDERFFSEGGAPVNKANQRLLGIILIILGGYFIVSQWIPAFSWRPVWAVTFIVIGLVLLVKGVKGNG
ncbi:MAG: PspC domain-containing protein [Bacillota bacterium]